MQLISVFDGSELPQDLYEYASEEQLNDSFRRVRLPYGTGEWDDNGVPLDNGAKLAQWCMDNGAKADGKYAYCLISI